MKKSICFFLGWATLFACSPLYAAPTGYCTADGGTHISELTINSTIAARDNVTGHVASTTVDNGNLYQGTCYCVTDRNGQWHNDNYTAVINPSLIESANRGNVQYYQLDEFLDVGISIEIYGTGLVNAPFKDVINHPNGVSTCTNGIKTSKFDSGSKGIIYFYVTQPFTGKTAIPRTLISHLYSTINPEYPLTEPLADIYISGYVEATQECEINGGQIITVNFDKIPATEFSSTRGGAITSRRIEVPVTVSCTGMARGQGIQAEMQANPVAGDPSMIQTDNPDVGIKIYTNDQGKELGNVNGGKMPAAMGNPVLGRESGSLSFWAAPASATGTKPEPGAFNAQAILVLEVTN